MNIILYSRVSTHDQSTAAQLLELRAIAVARKWNVLAEFEDVISGATKSRPALDRLLERVRAGGVDAVAVVKIDRLGRSLQNFLALVTEMKSRGCSIICTSQGIDTTSENPCGTLMANMLASFAQFERALIRERTCAGLAAARADGKVLGRPSLTMVPKSERADIISAWEFDGKNGGYRGLASLLHCSVMTARRIYLEAAPVAPISPVSPISPTEENW